MFDRSSLILDQSQLSVLAHRPKTQLQIKNEQLMKQLSGARTLIRQLKQDNEWLKTTKEGLQNQCFTLKELLQEKKKMLIEANSQMKMANQQINRLEDENSEKDDLIESYLKQRQKQSQQLHKKGEYIKILQDRMQEKDLEISNLQKQLQRIATQNKVQKQQCFHSIDQKLSLILQNQFEGSEVEQVQGEQKDGKIECILRKIEEIVNRQRQNKSLYQQKLATKKEEIEFMNKQMAELTNKMTELTNKLANMEQLVQKAEQTQIKNEKTIQVMKIAQNKDNIQANQSYKQLFTHHVSSVSQLINLFTPLLKGEEQVLYSLGELLKLKKPHRQVEILIDQIKGVILQKNIQTHRGGQTLKQLKDQQNRYQELEEELETFKLKHMSLQREYEAIMDDNRRIMKFHSLSRYRMERNSKGDKENISSANRNKLYQKLTDQY